MNDHAFTLVLGFLSAIPSCASALTAYLAYRSSLRNREELKQTNANVALVSDKVEAVHVATNSLTDRLVAATDAAAEARGRDVGRGEGIAFEQSRINSPPLKPDPHP